jgi:hypothetical protein
MPSAETTYRATTSFGRAAKDERGARVSYVSSPYPLGSIETGFGTGCVRQALHSVSLLRSMRALSVALADCHHRGVGYTRGGGDDDDDTGGDTRDTTQYSPVTSHHPVLSCRQYSPFSSPYRLLNTVKSSVGSLFREPM